MGIPTGWELILLLGVLVLLFGATKLPTAARSIGQSLRIFKAETKGMRSDDEEATPSSQRPQQEPAQPPAGAASPQVTPQQQLPLGVGVVAQRLVADRGAPAGPRDSPLTTRIR